MHHLALSVVGLSKRARDVHYFDINEYRLMHNPTSHVHGLVGMIEVSLALCVLAGLSLAVQYEYGQLRPMEHPCYLNIAPRDPRSR
jgi:hypothetical protein